MSWISDFAGAGASLLGSGLNILNQNEINRKNAELQREFAQNSIQWKVEDAKRAGIHPLAALGASGYSASPSYVGADNGIAQAGQQLSQGLSKALDKDAEKLSALKVKDAELEVQKKALEIRQMGQKVSADNFFGSVSNSSVPVPNGSAPTSGLSNSVVDSPAGKSPAMTASQIGGRVFDIGKGYQIQEIPPDENGRRRFHMGADPNSLLGQIITDGNLITGTLSQVTQFNRMRKAIDLADKWAREQGLLKPGQEFSRDVFNHTLDGFTLEIVDKNDKPKFKPQKQYLKNSRFSVESR